ncbi:hypothetical protein SS05631_c16160 [Sinorhizobium sp. CCBAU 05631]|nr:hypothetical protein SS05631_c16160 [Sinorhizobium sp. CCBAU 05631]
MRGPVIASFARADGSVRAIDAVAFFLNFPRRLSYETDERGGVPASKF